MPRADPAASSPRSIDSATLLGTLREAEIRHKGAVYTLRETWQGKVLLNK